MVLKDLIMKFVLRCLLGSIPEKIFPNSFSLHPQNFEFSIYSYMQHLFPFGSYFLKEMLFLIR